MVGKRASLSVRDRLDGIRQQDYVTIAEAALYFHVSQRTIWRKLPHLGEILRTGKLIRINRRTALRHFRNLPVKDSTV